MEAHERVVLDLYSNVTTCNSISSTIIRYTSVSASDTRSAEKKFNCPKVNTF